MHIELLMTFISFIAIVCVCTFILGIFTDSIKFYLCSKILAFVFAYFGNIRAINRPHRNHFKMTAIAYAVVKA